MTTQADLLTIDEAAMYLRTSPKAVYLMIERAQLPAACVVRLGRRVLVSRDALRKHLGIKQGERPV